MKKLKWILATTIVLYFFIGVLIKANDYTMSVEEICTSMANDKLEYELIYILGENPTDDDIKYQSMLLEPKYVDYINYCEFIFAKYGIHANMELVDDLYYKFISKKK